MITPRYQRTLMKVHAKGGGGGDTYDAAYNARMATIAEEQQMWAREMYDWYKHGSGGTSGHYEDRLVSEGGREWVDGSQSGSAQHPMVGRDAAEGLGGWSIGGGGQTGYWKETDPVYEKVWVEGTGGGYSYRDMENDMLLYNREEIAAAMGLLPEQTKLAHAQIGDSLTHIDQRAPVREEFYNKALKGMDPQQMANMAAADAAQAFANADASTRRNAARAGVGPDSGRYAAMSNANAMGQAKAVGAASTQARTAAENENFNRLNTAMGYGG